MKFYQCWLQDIHNGNQKEFTEITISMEISGPLIISEDNGSAQDWNGTDRWVLKITGMPGPGEVLTHHSFHPGLSEADP